MTHYDAGETVVIVRTSPGGSDPYGDPIEDTVTETPVEDCSIWPGASSEQGTTGRDSAVADLIVSMPSGTDIRRTDQVRARGVLWDVAGDPFDWLNPFTGWAPGIEVHLNRGEG
jgi:hypothetical protein